MGGCGDMVGSHPHIHPIAALGPTAHGGGAQGCAVPLWDLGGGGGGMLWGREGQPHCRAGSTQGL